MMDIELLSKALPNTDIAEPNRANDLKLKELPRLL
jgi:hypothetical protein